MLLFHHTLHFFANYREKSEIKVENEKCTPIERILLIMVTSISMTNHISLNYQAKS